MLKEKWFIMQCAIQTPQKTKVSVIVLDSDIKNRGESRLSWSEEKQHLQWNTAQPRPPSHQDIDAQPESKAAINLCIKRMVQFFKWGCELSTEEN